MFFRFAFLSYLANARVTLQDRNKNRCVVSFRSESEILFEKTCDIKTGDKAEFFIGDLSATESLDIEEVRTFSEFLSTIDFQSPVKWEGGENLQILIKKGVSSDSISDENEDYEYMYDADLDSDKKEFQDWEYNSGKTAAKVSIWASRVLIGVILVFIICLMFALMKLFNFMNDNDVKIPGYAAL